MVLLRLWIDLRTSKSFLPFSVKSYSCQEKKGERHSDVMLQHNIAAEKHSDVFLDSLEDILNEIVCSHCVR